MNPQWLKAQLAKHGLCILSLISKHTAVPHGHYLILVGHGATGFWPVFTSSKEYLDHQPDPIDRWSERIGKKFSTALCGSALFPFNGPPYHPFLTWAQNNGDSFPSPLGLHFHSQHGLWHAYRFGLVVKAEHMQQHKLSQPKPTSSSHPCTNCPKPCMNSCPVNAFSSAGYNVTSCRTYVAQNPSSGCALEGCVARLACPHNSPTGGYEADQHQYHMAVFASSN